MVGRFLAIFTLFFMLSVQPVFAASLPTIKSCVNPQGNVKASYESGTHGIVGDTATYQGKDTVYQAADNPNMYLQCFCNDKGGIQTNWVNAVSYTDSEIQILKSQGWIYVPNGSLWGLTNDPYIAKNDTFSCGNGGQSTGTSNGTSSSISNSVGGAVLSATTQVFDGLANTGNIIFLYGMLGLGALLFFAGLVIRSEEK